MGFLFMRLFRVVILFCLLGSIVHYLVNWKSYTFSPREVKRIAELYSGTGTFLIAWLGSLDPGVVPGQHPKQSAAKISADLRRRYGAHVIPDKEQEWHLGWFALPSPSPADGKAKGAGRRFGGMGFKYLFLHLSLTESVWIVGSPLRAQGSLGRRLSLEGPGAHAD